MKGGDGTKKTMLRRDAQLARRSTHQSDSLTRGHDLWETVDMNGLWATVDMHELWAKVIARNKDRCVLNA